MFALFTEYGFSFHTVSSHLDFCVLFENTYIELEGVLSFPYQDPSKKKFHLDYLRIGNV